MMNQFLKTLAIKNEITCTSFSPLVCLKTYLLFA